MNSEISGVVLIILSVFVLAYPLGKYISKIFEAEKTGQISFRHWKK